MQVFASSSKIIRWGLLAGVCAALGLSACSETKLAVTAAKQVAPTKTPTSMGSYKIGKPYQIDGTWYYPREDFDYVEEGVASWYGPSFNGKLTANGETYDMMDLTAAHRTLPMPSVVRVTNLENGRSLVVRVNDRGPFAKNRIIDVSKRAAQLLGFHNKGTTRVRVEVLADESRAMKAQAIAASGDMPTITPAPRAPVAVQPLEDTTTTQASSGASGSMTQTGSGAPLSPPAAETFTPAIAAVTSGTYVQAGAFSSMANAQRLQRQLHGVANILISPVQVNGQTLYRVRLGPVASTREADHVLQELQDRGLTGARLVSD